MHKQFFFLDILNWSIAGGSRHVWPVTHWQPPFTNTGNTYVDNQTLQRDAHSCSWSFPGKSNHFAAKAKPFSILSFSSPFSFFKPSLQNKRGMSYKFFKSRGPFKLSMLFLPKQGCWLRGRKEPSSQSEGGVGENLPCIKSGLHKYTLGTIPSDRSFGTYLVHAEYPAKQQQWN